MNLNLRQAIIQRMQDKTDSELQEVIEDSIDAEERVLPGLGVLFEMIWKNSSTDIRKQLTSTLKEQLTSSGAVKEPVV